MQQRNMRLLSHQARAHFDNEVIARCVRGVVVEVAPQELPDEIKEAAIAVGLKSVIVALPAKLAAAIQEAGLVVSVEQPKEKRFRVLIYDNANALEVMPADEFERSGRLPVLVAMGESGSADDALLHACLGYLRECDIERLGYIVPLEFHELPPDRPINEVTQNGKKFSDAEVLKLKQYLKRN